MKLCVLRVTDLLERSVVGRHAEKQLRLYVDSAREELRSSVGKLAVRSRQQNPGASEPGKTLARAQSQLEQDVDNLRQLLMEEALDACAPIIEELARDVSLQTIVSSTMPSIVYYSEEVDVTSQVLEKLDALAVDLIPRLETAVEEHKSIWRQTVFRPGAEETR